MKYWLFDGEDIVGPFSPQELAARPGFSAVSMVCPESESEKQDAWKTADSFSDFEFDSETGQPTPISSQPTETPAEAAPIEQQDPVISQPTPAVQPAPVTQPTEEVKSIPLAAPIKLAAAEEEILPLSKPETESNQAEQTQSPAEEAAPEPTTDSTQTDEPASETEPDTEVLSTCTLPGTEEAHVYSNSVLPTVDEIPTATMQEMEGPAGEIFQEPISVRERLTPRLETTPEIDDFLQEQQANRHPGRKKAKFMLWILLLLLLPGIIVLAIHLAAGVQTKINKTPKPALVTPTQPEPTSMIAQAPQAEPEVLPKDSATSTQEKAPKPAPAPLEKTPRDEAIEIAKNHQLPNNKGTVSAFFERAYQDKLASGYNAKWSAEPLHKNIYIVKYRLTKTRKEPIVYVFQADVSKKKLTGALNNVALDLVGKI